MPNSRFDDTTRRFAQVIRLSALLLLLLGACESAPPDSATRQSANPESSVVTTPTAATSGLDTTSAARRASPNGAAIAHETLAAGTSGESTRAYLEAEVDLPAERLNEVKPERPSEAGKRLSGEVLVQFAVDTAGLVDMSTFKTVDSGHPLLADAVKRVTPQLRFAAAVLRSRKVKQVVQQRFIFK